jgi:hypothetical protein
MKVRILKTIRNILISIVVLVLLVVGGGVGYTWYVGKYETPPPAATAAPVAPTPAPVVTPTKPAANAKESASIQMLSSPVLPGANATVTVKTNAGSKCTIAVVYDKTPSTDSGLAQKVADEFGIVSWTWTVESTVPLGKWPVKITCLYNDQSAVVVGDLVVSNKAE